MCLQVSARRCVLAMRFRSQADQAPMHTCHGHPTCMCIYIIIYACICAPVASDHRTTCLRWTYQSPPKVFQPVEATRIARLFKAYPSVEVILIIPSLLGEDTNVITQVVPRFFRPLSMTKSSPCMNMKSSEERFVILKQRGRRKRHGRDAGLKPKRLRYVGVACERRALSLSLSLFYSAMAL